MMPSTYEDPYYNDDAGPECQRCHTDYALANGDLCNACYDDDIAPDPDYYINLANERALDIAEAKAERV